MKASELIQKLLELTQEAGKDLDVVYDYQDGWYDLYHPAPPKYHTIWHESVERKPADLDENYEVIVIS